MNIVDYPILMIILVVSYQFEEILQNLSIIDQSIVSRSLRNFVKPKKSEKAYFLTWLRFGCVFVIYIHIYIYIYIYIYIPSSKNT